MSLLNVLNLHKSQGGKSVVAGIQFKQEKLQKISIAGETGSGKTTLLKMIAGIVTPDEGEVWFRNERVKRVPQEKLIPGHPGIGYLSQHFELPNNYRVEELLSYANVLKGNAGDTLYKVCRIDHLLTRRTDQLSGGEKQRIALARLLSGAPGLLLLDEPFSNLDMAHKKILKTIIHDLSEKLHITCILVSHDPLDTLSWADKILVMKEGIIVQEGTPQQIYREPINEYVAGLFGKYNIISDKKVFPFLKTKQLNSQPFFVRPEDVLIVKDKKDAVKGKVIATRFFGAYYELIVAAGGNELIVYTRNEYNKGDEVNVVF